MKMEMKMMTKQMMMMMMMMMMLMMVLMRRMLKMICQLVQRVESELHHPTLDKMMSKIQEQSSQKQLTLVLADHYRMTMERAKSSLHHLHRKHSLWSHYIHQVKLCLQFMICRKNLKELDA
jgi:hypothetical protein